MLNKKCGDSNALGVIQDCDQKLQEWRTKTMNRPGKFTGEVTLRPLDKNKLLNHKGGGPALTKVGRP